MKFKVENTDLYLLKTKTLHDLRIVRTCFGVVVGLFYAFIPDLTQYDFQ